MKIRTGILTRAIRGLYFVLFFFTPLFISPGSSEIFEFPKILFVYLVTVLIIGLWIIKMIVEKSLPTFTNLAKLVTLVLLLFITSQIISTIWSSDIYTSVFGYYGRWHGGLLSSISYALLFLGFVANVDAKNAKKAIYFVVGPSVLVAIYALLQRLGIDRNLWNEDAVSRVFATFGQPNWLAAWLASLIPVVWALLISTKAKLKTTTTLLYIILSLLLISALTLTKSRSGLLGFGISALVFWPLAYWQSYDKAQKKLVIKLLLTLFVSTFVVITLITITQNSNSKFASSVSTNNLNITPSSQIRKNLWQAGIAIWQSHPIIGTGVETFAFHFPLYKPVEHNMTSEWNLIYVKAHNEYLNFAATTGVFGLLTYLILIVLILITFIKSLGKTHKSKGSSVSGVLISGLLAGFVSILATNFFGFSVVSVTLNFLLFPAIALALQNPKSIKGKAYQLSLSQSATILATVCVSLFAVNQLFKYWRADYLYAKALTNTLENPTLATHYLTDALNLKYEPVYLSELANAQANLAIEKFENSQPAIEGANLAVESANRALRNSPLNISFTKNKASILVRMAGIDSTFYSDAREVYESLTRLAPKDPDVWFKYGLYLNRAGQVQESIEALNTAVNLKPNYKEPRLALAAIYQSLQETEKAIKEANYIITNIDSNDQNAKLILDSAPQ